MIELEPGEKAFLSLQLPPEFVIIFDAVTHSTRCLIPGERRANQRSPARVTMVISRGHAVNETLNLRPGPLRLSLENHTDVRVLPNICVAGEDLHDILGHRRPFLTPSACSRTRRFATFSAPILSISISV